MPSWLASRPAISIDSSFGNQLDPVNHVEIERVRDEAGADTLYLVGSGLYRLIS
jgi:hypothetical protein